MQENREHRCTRVSYGYRPVLPKTTMERAVPMPAVLCIRSRKLDSAAQRAHTQKHGPFLLPSMGRREVPGWGGGVERASHRRLSRPSRFEVRDCILSGSLVDEQCREKVYGVSAAADGPIVVGSRRRVHTTLFTPTGMPLAYAYLGLSGNLMEKLPPVDVTQMPPSLSILVPPSLKDPLLRRQRLFLFRVS